MFNDFESKLGLKNAFFEKVLLEDDWSFIIKIHAYFEAACTHLLITTFGNPAFTEIFSRLELSNKKTGKLAFISQANLIDEFDKKLIYELSEIRNKLVHDIRNVEFDLVKYVSDMDKNQKKQFISAFSPGATRYRKLMENPESREKYFNESWERESPIEKLISWAERKPKNFIWFGCMQTMAEMHPIQ